MKELVVGYWLVLIAVICLFRGKLDASFEQRLKLSIILINLHLQLMDFLIRCSLVCLLSITIAYAPRKNAIQSERMQRENHLGIEWCVAYLWHGIIPDFC